MCSVCDLPELIDHTFEYLDRCELYTCLLVCHQFNAHATRLLYRRVTFVEGFAEFYADEPLELQKFTKQSSLWDTIYKRPCLAQHIRYLDIDLLYEVAEPMVPSFSERIDFIIRRAVNLCTLHYTAIDNLLGEDYSFRFLKTCIATLESSKINPNLHIAHRRSIVEEPLCNLLVDINHKFPVTWLDVCSEEIDDNSLLTFLSQFHNLRVLEISNCSRSDNNCNDMNRFLGHLPLQELFLVDTKQITSFPQQITALTLHAITLLTNGIWAAACNLKCLSKLEIECDDIEARQNEESITFQSSNLQTLSGSLAAKTEEILRHQIIQPILVSCNNLTSIELTINSPLSTILLTLLLSRENLIKVKIISAASLYTFQEFSALSKTPPNLKGLQLSWPASIGVATNDTQGTVIGDRSQDVPERVTFDQCQLLAEKFPKLTEIGFEIDSDNWCSSYETYISDFRHHMPVDLALHDINKLEHDQGFKMAAFINELPCLNLCSVFVSRGEDSQMSMRLFLLLNQIRRHVGKP